MMRAVYDRWEIKIPYNQYYGYDKLPFYCDCDCGERAKKERNSSQMKCSSCNAIYQMSMGQYIKIENR